MNDEIKDSFKEKIIDAWRDATNFWRLRSIKRKINRLIYWFPIIWHDEDWDYWHLLRIMKAKIARIRKDMEKANRHVGCEKDILNMKIAEELLRRIVDNDYKQKDRDDLCTCPTDDKFSEKYYEKTKFCRKWIFPYCDYCEKFKYKKLHQIEEETWNFLFDHLKKNMQRWWN